MEPLGNPGRFSVVRPRFHAHFTPCVEIGWRLSVEHWGYGYTTEGAKAVLALGFGHLGLLEIVALTIPANYRSRRVMERIGMSHNPADDFDHPDVPEPMKRHVLYRIGRQTAQHALAARDHETPRLKPIR